MSYEVEKVLCIDLQYFVPFLTVHRILRTVIIFHCSHSPSAVDNELSPNGIRQGLLYIWMEHSILPFSTGGENKAYLLQIDFHHENWMNMASEFHFCQKILGSYMYSEKATNFWEISTVDFYYKVTVKSIMEILKKIVALSEYMHFTYSVCGTCIR